MSSDEKKKQKDVEDMLNQMDNLGAAVGAHMKANAGVHPELLKQMSKKDPKDKSLKDTLRAKNDAPSIIQMILNDLESGKVKPPVSYVDPCQSPVLDIYESQLLREKWGSGMDMPHSMNRPCGMRYFSKVFMAAFLGNYDDYIRIVENLSKEEISTMLKKREGYLCLSPIFLPIIGARIFYQEDILKFAGGREIYSPLVQQRCQRMHMEVLKKMIELGADLNAHDLAGYTPLHHCLTCSGNEYTMKMAEVLLKNGANVNGVNRFGDYPLMECIQIQNIEFIKLLIRYKADPLIKNYEGFTARYVGRHTPKICALLKEGEKNVVREERRAAKVDKKHKVCGKCAGFAEKRCSSCFLVWYCGPECQKSDWTAHKGDCQRIRDEYIEVPVLLHDKDDATPFSVNTRKYHPNRDDASRGHFIVKVQPPMEKKKKGKSRHLFVYNEKRDVQYWIKEDTEVAKLLTKAVDKQESNIIGKGFFYSVIRNGKHYIHPKVLLPETW